MAVKLHVKDKEILSTEITYEDLVILYQQFINTYGEIPVFTKCDSKHNMPQRKIINRILNENNVTYNDFLNMFGKTFRVRTESKDYNLFVEKYKEISGRLGNYITSDELTNNSYGLPSSSWFVKYCPNKDVKNFTDFIKWCGFNPTEPFSKEYISNELIKLEKSLDRPITKNDISLEKTGFSMIVINRLYGGLNNAKEELGLLKSKTSTPKPFEYYKNALDTRINLIYKNTGKEILTWKDIEDQKYGGIKCEHKTLKKAFDREGIDIFAYIKSLGFIMNTNTFGNKYTFDDGERTLSSMEYDFSTYIRSLGFEYKKSYYRDIPYHSFTSEMSKINCDYKISINDKFLYVEIAGIIYNPQNETWENYQYETDTKNEYKDKMIRKKSLLEKSNCNYLILLQDDMSNDIYKQKLKNKINEML